MKKLKFLLLALAATISLGAWAETDVTNTYLQNANLKSLDGWDILDNFKTAWITDGDVAAIEFYSAWSDKPGEPWGKEKFFNFSQSPSLPAGYYRLCVNAFYREGNGNGTNTKAYIYAGSKNQYVVGLSSAGVSSYTGKNDLYKAANAFSLGEFSNEFDFQVTEENANKPLEIGFHGVFNTWCSWCCLGPVTIYEYGVEDYMGEYDKLVPQATVLYDSPMNAGVLSALKEAADKKESLSTIDEVLKACEVLKTKIADAKASIAEYVKINGMINLLNENGKSAFTESIGKYNSGEWLDYNDFIEGSSFYSYLKKYPKNNTDFTMFIVNPEINGSDGWTCEKGKNGGNGPLLNGNSFEYWIGTAANGGFDYYQVINDLPNGHYNIGVQMYNSSNGVNGDAPNGNVGLYGFANNTQKFVGIIKDEEVLSSYTLEDVIVTDGTLRLGVKNNGTMGARWFVADNFTLTFVSHMTETDAALLALQTILGQAKTLIDADAKATVSLKSKIATDYETYSAYTSSTDIEDIKAATTDMTAQIAALNASIADYAKLKDAIDNYYYPVDPNYDNLESVIAAAKEHYEKADLESCSECIASLSMSSDAVKAAMVNDYMYVTGTEENLGKYIYGVSLGEWTRTGYVSTFSNEHWSETTHDYMNQDDSNGRGWNSPTGFEIGLNQNVTLPAGNYVFKACGRKSGDAVLELLVKSGDNVIGRVANFPSSNNAKGIDKDGVTSFDGDNFANSGNGFGWQWRYVAFTLEKEATINVAVSASATTKYQWVSFGDYTIQTDNEANLAMIAYNIALNDAKLAKKDDAYKNVTGAELTALNTAIDFETAGKTKTEIEEATIALQNATSAFKAAAPAYDNYLAILEKVENLDDAGKAKFNELAADINGKFDDATIWAADLANVTDFYIAAVKAQTTIDSDWSALGGTDRSAWDGATGNYATNYVEKYAENGFEAGNVLTQTIEGLMPYAKYEVKFTAVASHARGLTDDAHGNGIAQVFANDNAIDIEVLHQEACDPTDSKYQYTLEGYADKDGNLIFGLKNIKAGGQWYVAQFTSLILKALPSSFDATMTKVGDAAYSSMYLDFPVEIPEGVKAYYVTVEVRTATMNEIEGVIPANCGVILKAAEDVDKITFTQTSTEATTDVSSNVLIGFVVDNEVNDGKAHYAFSYKTGDTKPAFYIPESAESDTDPTSKFTAKAHKAYIELESTPNAKLDIAWGGEATGINTIDNGQLTIDNSKAYNLNGMRVSSNYKGIVLKGGKKFLQK